jgi:adenosylmethionine-8-amino-7-oxononanoate aminotransferase
MQAEKLEHTLAASTGRNLPVAVRGSGCRIWDREGREYLDACGGAMVMSLGHCHPRLVEAAKRQLDRLTFTYRFSFSNEPMADLSSLIREIAPMQRASAFFNSSGSESIESAIHMAILYWQHLGTPSKIEFISRYPSFHGSTLGALGLSSSRWRKEFELVLEKNAIAQVAGVDIRARRSEKDELRFGLEQIEDAIVSRGPDHVAAVFLEPISGASAAAVVPPEGYIDGVRELCNRYGVLMICDETITGFGRTGAWWASSHWEGKPDILTFAKGVTSGITPFSGMTVAERVAEVFLAKPEGFAWGHTFSGNPLGCAVAAEAIRTIRDDDLITRGRTLGERLRAGMESIAAASPHIGQVRGKGLLQGMELVTDRDSLEPLAGASNRLAGFAKELGLMIYSCSTPLGRRTIEAVMLAPPLIVEEADIDEILEKLSDALRRFDASPRIETE